MPRAMHRWTAPERPSIYLSIRLCRKCGLAMHSRHEGHEHWKEYYLPAYPDVRLTKMPECEREEHAL